MSCRSSGGGQLPGSGGARCGGDEERGAESSSIVAAGAQTLSLHQQETLEEGDSVEELGQRPLLLSGGSAEVQEHRLQTWKKRKEKSVLPHAAHMEGQSQAACCSLASGFKLGKK